MRRFFPSLIVVTSVGIFVASIVTAQGESPQPTAAPIFMRPQGLQVIFQAATRVYLDDAGGVPQFVAEYDSGIEPRMDLLVQLEDGKWYGPERCDDEIDALRLPSNFSWQTSGDFQSLATGEAWWEGPSVSGDATLTYPGGAVQLGLRVEILPDQGDSAIVVISSTMPSVTIGASVLPGEAGDSQVAEAVASGESISPTSAMVDFPPGSPPTTPIVFSGQSHVVFHDAFNQHVEIRGGIPEWVGMYRNNTPPWLDLQVRDRAGSWYGPERRLDDLFSFSLPDGYHWETTGGFQTLLNGEAWWIGPSFQGEARLHGPDGEILHVRLRVEQHVEGDSENGGSDEEAPIGPPPP